MKECEGVREVVEGVFCGMVLIKGERMKREGVMKEVGEMGCGVELKGRLREVCGGGVEGNVKRKKWVECVVRSEGV